MELFFFFNFILFLAVVGLCCCRGFSLVVGAGASHCGGFSCGAQALGPQTEQLWLTGPGAHRLQHSWRVGSAVVTRALEHGAQVLWCMGLVAAQNVTPSWARD